MLILILISIAVAAICIEMLCLRYWQKTDEDDR